jgi:hypothetical protein
MWSLSDTIIGQGRHIPARFVVHESAATTPEGRSMRSLWRLLASQWLGGEGSETLTGEATVLDVLLSGEPARPTQTFDVRREPGVSHQAMMSPDPECLLKPEIASGLPRRHD